MAAIIVQALMVCTLCMTSFIITARTQSPHTGLDSESDLPTIQIENTTYVIMESDILMPMDEYREMEAHRAAEAEGSASGRTRRRKRGLGRKSRWWRWRNNKVYYTIKPQFTASEIFTILRAIDVWQQYTCLSFRQWDKAPQRIEIQNPKKVYSCYALVGRTLKPQPLVLGSKGCRVLSKILHELGHSIGLFHEQSRPDRDRFVDILKENIQVKSLNNFKKFSEKDVDTFGTPYDYKSIMHYGSYFFSKNRKITIRTKSLSNQGLIGKSRMLSFNDIKIVNKMYNCHRHTTGCTKTDAECPGVGFVGKDCTCWCPSNVHMNPIKGCSPGTKPQFTTPPATSVNYDTVFLSTNCPCQASNMTV